MKPVKLLNTGPEYYKAHPRGIECIEVSSQLSFDLGNAIKYLWRAGQKPGEGYVRDLKKAEWYIRFAMINAVPHQEQPVGKALIGWVISKWRANSAPKFDVATIVSGFQGDVAEAMRIVLVYDMQPAWGKDTWMLAQAILCIKTAIRDSVNGGHAPA